ncbi:MAG TPA: glycosyltransferase family 1 protein [Flavobacteriaceae bacterium]|jgi:glycosyltransferase involved in cell wall biosynthesis|nr:glycosyltransferase family 1 protein [Flavobacteriaceae bacterium]HIN99816.1 glycosyltransferase family 1 protein [Flavobacteriaceae bacterium]|tara:strand:+ start:34181 stop:35317 length:1137 start_codon:yes stop_codon:yes gene_type:complete
MKILLVGEYNASHFTLKEGLVQLGHEVTVVGLGDGFKNRKVDVNFNRPYENGAKAFFKRIVYKLFKVDLNSVSIKKQFQQHRELFSGNDIVQLINENSFGTVPEVEQQLLDFIFQHNKKVFLLSCGTDHLSVKYAMEEKFRYSIATPYLEKRGTEAQFLHMTQYIRKDFEALHHFIMKHIEGIIASDLDYHIPLLGHPKYLGMVPNPVHLAKFPFKKPVVKDKVVIFHGINQNNYYKKGNDIFEAALAFVAKTHSEKIEVITVRSVPYETYIKLFDDCHILLDQVYAYDQGFNALEAMAKGKVVFTGAEQEFLDYYHLKEDEVAINALPDARSIADKLIGLIENPEKISEIATNARAFVEKEHDHILASQRYFEKWTS